MPKKVAPILMGFDLMLEGVNLDEYDYLDDIETQYFVELDHVLFSLTEIMSLKSPWMGGLPKEYYDWDGMTYDMETLINIIPDEGDFGSIEYISAKEIKDESAK